MSDPASRRGVRRVIETSLRWPAIVLLLSTAPAVADDHRPEDWPEGSAMHTGRTAQLELAEADRKLNAVYRQLIEAMPADEPDHYPRRALLEAQRAWIRWRDASCALVGETEGGMRMWKSALDTACRAETTRERVAELEELLERIAAP